MASPHTDRALLALLCCSSWERGSIFAEDPSADESSEDPVLDLSCFTAGCKDDASIVAFDYGDFMDLFSPAEMGLAFHPASQAAAPGTWNQPAVVPGSSVSETKQSNNDLMVPCFDFPAEAPGPAKSANNDWLPSHWVPSSSTAQAMACDSSSAGSLSSDPFAASAGVVPTHIDTSCMASFVPSASYGALPPAAAAAAQALMRQQQAAWAAYPTMTGHSSTLLPLSSSAVRSLAATSVCPASGIPIMPEVRTRSECLERYREKKARRQYNKTIRYQLRKINADNRPRIKGRFVKKDEAEEVRAAANARNARMCANVGVFSL